MGARSRKRGRGRATVSTAGVSRATREARQEEAPEPAADVLPDPDAPMTTTDELLTRGERRKKADDELRASLQPFAKGERPAPLVVAVVVATLLGLGNLLARLAGVEVDGNTPSWAGVAGFSGIMLIAAWGMWTKRYWAVLGFQVLLALVVVFFSLFALRASSAGAVLVAGAFVLLPGWLFWKLVRVLARMQVPQRP